MKRVISFLLSVMMVFSMLPVEALAADNTENPAEYGLCEHHTVHDDSCGYAAAQDEVPCDHQHTEECYQSVQQCVHTEHDADCGYIAAVECDHVHDESCGYDAETDTGCTHVHGECSYVEGAACSHECGTDCYETVLNCQHVCGAGSCSYQAAVEASQCQYECEECAAAIAANSTGGGIDTLSEDEGVTEASEGEDEELEYMDQAALNEALANAEGTLVLSGNLVEVTENTTVNTDLAIVNGTIFKVNEGATLTFNGECLTVDNANLTVNGELAVNTVLWIVNGGYVNLSGTATLTTSHIYENAEIDIYGSVTNNGYLCVHPGGSLCINNGATVQNNNNETTGCAYIDDRGYTYIDGTLNNDGLLTVGVNEDEGETGTASLNIAESGVVTNSATSTVGISSSGILNVNGELNCDGEVDNAGNVTVSGNGKMVIGGKLTNNNFMLAVSGGSITVDGSVTNNQWFHVGMDAEEGTLNINGTMTNNSYLCIHPNGTMNVNDGGWFGNQCSDDGQQGFVQCNGTLNVYNAFDNMALMIVDNTAEDPAVMNVYADGYPMNLDNGDMTIGDNGILNLNGELFNAAYLTIAGEATINGTLWKKGTQDVKLVKNAVVVNNGTIEGNVVLSGNAQFTNNGTVGGEVVNPMTTAAFKDLLDEAQSRGETSYSLNEAVTLDADLTIDQVNTVIFGEGGSITVPAGVTLEISNGSFIVAMNSDSYVLINGTLKTNSEYAMQFIEGSLYVGENAVLNTGSGHISMNLGTSASVNGVDISKVHANAHPTSAEELELACGDGEEFYRVSVSVETALTLDRDITVPETGILQLCNWGDNIGSLTVPSGYTLTNEGSIVVDSGCSLTIEAGGTLANNGGMRINGTYTNNGTLTGSGSIDFPIVISGLEDLKAALEEAAGNASSQNPQYVYLENAITLESGDSLTVPSYVSLVAWNSITVSSGATITIAQNSTLMIGSDSAVLDVAEGATIVNNGELHLSRGVVSMAGNYTSSGSSTLRYSPGFKSVTGFEKSQMIYDAQFDTEDELAAYLAEAAKGEYASYILAVEYDCGSVTLSGTHVIPAGVTLEVTYNTDLILASGANVTNNGTVNVYYEANLEVQEGAVLTNNGSIYLYSTGAVTGDGTCEGNDPITGGYYGTVVSTWAELKAALKDAGEWETVNLAADVSVPSSTTLSIPSNVCLALNGCKLTVPSSSKVKIGTGAQLAVYSGSTLTVKGSLANSGSLYVEGTAKITTYSGSGTVDMYEGATISGIAKSKIAYNLFVYDFASLKSELSAAASNGYKETYLITGSDMDIEESLTFGSKIGLVVGATNDTVTVPAGVTLTMKGGLFVSGAGVLVIKEGATVNINDLASIYMMAHVDNHGTLNVNADGEINISGTLNNYGKMSVTGTCNNYGTLNNEGEFYDGELAKLLKALQTGDSYTLTKPIVIGQDMELAFDSYKVIKVSGDGSIGLADGVNLDLSYVEVDVTGGGSIELGAGAVLNVKDHAYVEVQDGSLTCGDNAVINVATDQEALMTICDQKAAVSGVEDYSMLCGLRYISSQDELNTALEELDKYGQIMLISGANFSLKEDTVIPEKVRWTQTSNYVLTVPKGTSLTFQGLVNVIHGGAITVNGTLNLADDCYMNVASGSVVTVGSAGEMNVDSNVALNLGDSSTLANYGTVNNRGRINAQSGSTVVGNLINELPTDEGWSVATNEATLLELLNDSSVSQIEIRGDVVLTQDCAINISELLLLDGDTLTISNGVNVYTNCYIGIHGGTLIIENGHLFLGGNTDVGTTLRIEENGSVYNSGKFNAWGTVVNWGLFESDRQILLTSVETNEGIITEGTWIGNDPVYLEESTMTQDEFVQILKDYAEGGEWNWYNLYKGVTLERDLIIDTPVCMEFPSYIIVPEGVTLTIAGTVDMVEGAWIEVQEGGTLSNLLFDEAGNIIDSAELNVYDGEVYIRSGAALIASDWEGCAVNVGSGGRLIAEDGADVTQVTNWAVRFAPQYGAVVEGLDEYQKVASMYICNLDELKDAIENHAPYYEVQAKIMEPIVLEEDITFPGHLELNVYEFTDDEGNLIPGLIIPEGVTLNNEGRILIQEFAQVLVEEGAKLNNWGTIVEIGGKLIGSIADGNAVQNNGSTGSAIATSTAELVTWLEGGNDGQIEIVGEVTLTQDVTVHSNQQLYIGSYASLTVPEEYALTNDGGNIIIRGGMLTVEGSLVNRSYISVENRGVLYTVPGSYEAEGDLYFSEDCSLVNIDNEAATVRRYVSSEEELRNAANNFEGYRWVEVNIQGDITLTSNFILSSGVHVNIEQGTLTVASGNTMVICGSMCVYGDTCLYIENGAALENLGELIIYGEYINEGGEFVSDDAYLGRQMDVSSYGDWAYAMEHADQLDRIFVYGEIEVTEGFEIPEHLHVIVHGSLYIPEGYDVTVNGYLYLDGGIVDMYGGSLTNNGYIHTYWGGTLNVGDNVAVSGDGVWTMQQDGNIISTGNRLDGLIDFMCGGSSADDLEFRLGVAADREFKSEHVYVDGAVYVDRDLTVPAGTYLCLVGDAYLEVNDWCKLTNNGIIQISDMNVLAVNENATFTNAGTIEIVNGEGRAVIASDDTVGNIVQVFTDENGNTVREPVTYTWIDNFFHGEMSQETQLRAAIKDGYQYIETDGASIELTEDLELPSGSKLILEENSSLVVPEGVTLTINDRINIQGGSSVEVYGSLVNNVYDDDNNEATNDIGIWCEDGSLIIYEGSTYTNNGGGLIIVTSNYGFYVDGIENSQILRNTYVFSEAELRQVLETAGDYAYNQAIVYEDIVLTRGTTIPSNVCVYFADCTLTIPNGMTLINKGVFEIGGSDDNANVIVSAGATLYNYDTMKIGEAGSHATLSVDAGGRFYNYGELNLEQCGCDLEHYINKTVLVTGITASLNGNSEDPTISVNVPVQLTAAVEPAKATQKEVNWSLVSDDPDNLVSLNETTGELTVSDLNGMDEISVTVRATAVDGTGIYDELTIQVKEYHVTAKLNEEIDALTYGQKVTLSAECETGAKVSWSLKAGDEQFATLAVNSKTNVATLTAKTLTEKQTVTVIASVADGSATAAEVSVDILPKVQMVAIDWDGADVTGKTITYDIGNSDNADSLELKAVISPSDSGAEVEWKSDATKVATVDNDGKVTILGTGTVKLTATAQDGSKVAGSVTIEVVDLIQSIGMAANSVTELVGGETVTYSVFERNEDDELIGKKLSSSQVKWSLAEKDAAYASIKATSGKLTTKKVSEQVTITVKAEVIGNEENAYVICPVTIYPLTTQMEITMYDADGNSINVNDQTILLDRDTGKAYVNGTQISNMNGAALQLDVRMYPADVMPENNIKWTSSSTKIATVDAKTGMLVGVQNSDGSYKTGTVTITAAAQDGSGKKAAVKVQIGTLAKSVTIDPLENDVLRSGKSVTLTAVTDPVKPTTTGVTWSLVNAEDSAYVTLASSGKVTAKTVYDEHVVEIIATSKDGMAVSEPVAIVVKPAKDGILTLSNEFGENVTGTTYLLDMLGENREMILSAYTLGFADEIEDVTWTSSSKSIAKVAENDDGTATVTVLKSGTATITAKAADKRTATITIKATNLVAALEIESKTETFTVASGKTLTLTAAAFPTGASTKTVTWSLAPGGEEFASINSSGKLTAKANLTQAVTVTVIATAKDGSGVTAEAEIEILPLVQGVNIWMEDMGVITNTTLVWDMVETPYLSVNADTYPELASQNVTWKSSSAKIASIDAETGEITCRKAGTVTITATASDGSGKTASFKLTVVKRMTSLTLENQVIAGGKSLKLYNLVQILEADTTDKTLVWSLSGGDTAFATLTSDGKLTAKTVTGTKTVTVTAASTDGSELVAECEVTIMPAVTKVSIYEGDAVVTGSTITLGVGESLDLYAVNAPDGALQEWTWSSSNAAVKVDENGLATAVTAGKTVTITAKAADGSGKSAKVKIKTIQRMEELTLPATDIVASTKSITLKAGIAPSNTTTKTVKWSIVSGSEYATIDKNGKLTAKKLTGDEAVYVTVMAASTDGSNLAAITKVMITPLTTKVHILDIDGSEMVQTTKLYVGEGMMYLTGSSDPASAAQTYTWTVSNAKYAGFAVEGEDGTVAKTTGTSVGLQALVPGKTVTVTATADDGSGVKASFKVTTVQRMQTLTMDETAVLGEGKSLTLRANAWPANTTNKNLTWELIEGHDYVTLSAKGVLKAKSGVPDDGVVEAIVRVSSNDGSDLSAECTVTIHPLTKSVQIQHDYDESVIWLMVGSRIELDGKGYINTSDLEDEVNNYAADDFTWTSSSGSYVGFVNEDDETVSSTSGGNVTIEALKPGKTVTITGTAKDGSGKKDTIKIKTYQPVESITLPENLVVTPGRSITLKADIYPANATDKTLHWDILQGEEYVTISSKGVLTAKKGVQGNHDIVVQARSVYTGADTGYCIVKLSQRTTKVTAWNGSENVTGKTINLYTNQPLFIAGDSDPDDAHTEYTWKVSKSNYAGFLVGHDDEETGEYTETVESTCIGACVDLVALEPGKTVTVTAAAMDGSGKQATFKVKTLKAVDYLLVEDREVSAGRSIVLRYDEITEGASNTKVSWEILDETDAAVLFGNFLFARRTDEEVTVNLRATAQDGNGATCDFTVTIVP